MSVLAQAGVGFVCTLPRDVCVLLHMAAIALALAGCAGSDQSTSAEPPLPLPLPLPQATAPILPPGDISLFGIAGRTLLIPLAAPADFPPGQLWVPDVRAQPLLDGKTPLLAELIGLVGAVDLGARLRSPSPWLPDPVIWTPTTKAEVTAGAAPRGAAFVWALAVELPTALANRQAITIDLGGPDGGTHIVVRILPAPAPGLDTRLLPTPDARFEAWRRLGERLLTEARDPFRRWRLWLLMDRFDEKRLFGPGGFPSRDPLGDPILRRIASMVEERWRIAIEQLTRADPSVAAALVTRLTAVARAPSGELLPVWSLNATDEYDLLEDLLNPRLRANDRVARAQQWLNDQRRMVAWVIDDAGQDRTVREAPEGPEVPQHLVIDGARIGVIDLTGARTTATAGPARGTPVDRQLRDAATLRELSTAVLEVRAVSTDGSGAAPVLVRAGAASAGVNVVAAPLLARPPGLAIGPLLEGASLALLPSGRATNPPGAWATAAMLHRTLDGQWQLHVEARQPRDIEALESAVADEVTIHLGPMGAGGRTITVGPARGADRVGETVWTALIDLPPSAVRGGELLLGITRRDPRGAIQAWPRPLLPGDTEPGRLRIDLARWGGFEGDFEGL